MANPVDVTSPADAAKAETALPPVQFETATPAKTEVPKVEVPKVEAPKVEAPKVEAAKPAPAAMAPVAAPARPAAPKRPEAATLTVAPQPVAAAAEPARSNRFALLAASVALAAGTGAVLGAAGASFVLPAPATAIVQAAGGDDIRALKESIVRLSSELTAVKASVESAAKSASGQIGRLAANTEKAIEKSVDKAVEKSVEKAQAEPKATLAKITESLERLEKRPVQAAAVAAPETTGSVPAAQAEAKPQIVPGWIVRDFFDGRALVESRFGTMLDVGPGSNIPGVGKVEAVRRQDGRIVVVTAKGLITSFR